MLPLEMAMKLASASTTCERHKCPFMAKCKGDYSTCVMKEIALMLRAQNAEIESLKSMVTAYQNIIATTQIYINDIESQRRILLKWTATNVMHRNLRRHTNRLRHWW